MAIVSRTVLKAYFEAGDKPTQDQFIDLIDSFLNFIDDGIYGIQKVTKTFADFQPSSLDSVYVDLFQVPAGFQVSRIIIRPTESFTGGTIADTVAELYDSSDSLPYDNGEQTLSAAVTDTTGRICPGTINDFLSLSDVNSDSFVRLNLRLSGATDGMNDLDQGSVDYYYTLDKLI